MKICLVTTFPPSTGGLSEYGFHIAQELQRNPFLNLTVLADELGTDHGEIDGFSVMRCWSFDDPASSYRLLKTLHRLKPDVVWFNLLFSTFGRNPLVAFSGLMTPLTRSSHRSIHTRYAAPSDGHGRTEGCWSSPRAALPIGRCSRDANAAAFQFGVGADAWLPQDT